MDNKLTQTVNGNWGRVASPTESRQLLFEVELYKKFIDIFHVGQYFYSIFSYARNDFELVDRQLEKVLGYPADRWNVSFLMNCIHPDDLPYFVNFENAAIDFLSTLTGDDLVNYKILHDYRLRKADGNYLRMLQQGIVLEHDENGGILRTLIVHTEISHLKGGGKPVLSFIGMQGRQSFVDLKPNTIIAVRNEVLTRREQEILHLMIDGRLSKEIAHALGISKQTVDRHRKNMLAKTGLSTGGELIAKAISNGWV